MMRGEAPPGRASPRSRPGFGEPLLWKEARGVWALGTAKGTPPGWGRGEGAGTRVLEGFGAEWVKSRDPGPGEGSGARSGGELGTWAGVAGELRTSPPYCGGSSGLLCWR